MKKSNNVLKPLLTIVVCIIAFTVLFIAVICGTFGGYLGQKEIEKIPLVQNYELNREKILDLLEFVRRNISADLRVSITANHIEIDSGDDGIKISSRNIKDGLKFIGWDTAKFKELRAKLESVNSVKVTLNSDKSSKTEPAATITYRHIEHYMENYEFYTKDSPRLQELYDKGCAKKYEDDGAVFITWTSHGDKYQTFCVKDDGEDVLVDWRKR
jgi:hypothetical protein